jgi:hypothetical protein
VVVVPLDGSDVTKDDGDRVVDEGLFGQRRDDGSVGRWGPDKREEETKEKEVRPHLS